MYVYIFFLFDKISKKYNIITILKIFNYKQLSLFFDGSYKTNFNAENNFLHTKCTWGDGTYVEIFLTRPIAVDS